jgi:hypothetical protein
MGMRDRNAGSAATNGERFVPHFYKRELPALVTFRTEGTLALTPKAREAVMTRVLSEHGKRYAVFALVVMEDHAHIVLQALQPERGWPFDIKSIVEGLKEGSAVAVQQAMGVQAMVWQADTFSVQLRSQEILDEKCKWVRMNPVRSKAASSPEDYPWLWENAQT